MINIFLKMFLIYFFVTKGEYIIIQLLYFYLLLLDSICSVGGSGYNISSSDENLSIEDVSDDNSYSLPDLLQFFLLVFLLFTVAFCLNSSLLEERLFVTLALLTFHSAILYLSIK